MSVLVPLPTGAAEINFSLPRRAAFVVKSGYSPKQTVIDRGSILDGWRASLSIVPNDDMRPWRAWMAAMLGPVNFTDLETVITPQVASLTNPTISAVTSPAQITLTGLPESQTGYLKAGALMTIYTGASSTKPRLVTLLADASSSAAGTGVVLFDPPIGGLVTGRVCVVRVPFCRMNLAPPFSLGYALGLAEISQPAPIDLVELVE